MEAEMIGMQRFSLARLSSVPYWTTKAASGATKRWTNAGNPAR